MPLALLDRLPLPNFKTYTAGSVVLVSVAVYYAMSVTSDPNWRVNATVESGGGPGGGQAGLAPPAATLAGVALNGTRNFSEQFVDVMTFMMQEPLCMWTLVNIAYCSLALFGFLIKHLVFGALRETESQRVENKFWNYVFYKFIFIFGVMNVQYMNEVLLWCAWFTVLGFMQLLATLCKYRYEYLSSSPNSSNWAHFRLLCLLSSLFMGSAFMMAIASTVGPPRGMDVYAFMVPEVFLVLLSTMHVLSRYYLKLRGAEAGGAFTYYTRLIFHGAALVVETADVAHMVVWSQWAWSLASIVLVLQLRALLHRLRATFQHHSLYSHTKYILHHHYPMATKEEVERNEDKCAICWDQMKEARKLPCSHLFHSDCLCRWVQQDASCPTCRAPLHRAPAPAPATARMPPTFRIEGWRYVSWLPSVSVQLAPPPDPRQLLFMTMQVRAMFPQFSASRLAEDLARSRSAHATVDNILEGRLLPDLLPPPPRPEPTRHLVVDFSAETEPRTAAAATDTQLDNSQGTETDPPAGHFSSLAAEREAMLQRRKDAMVAAARRRFLERHPPS